MRFCIHFFLGANLLTARYNALMEMMLDGTGPLVSAQGYCTAKIRPLHIYKL